MKKTIKLTESDLQNIIKESVYNLLSEQKKKREPRTGTIEINGEQIRAIEDGLDKYGNPMYKVKHHSITGRKTKDGYTRIQHYNFKPDRFNESVNHVLKEGVNNNNYTHFAINKQTNLIVDGWDYSNYDSYELKNNKNYYFYDDLKDNDFNPKEYKILTYKGCLKQGINPDDDKQWSNDGIIPC